MAQQNSSEDIDVSQILIKIRQAYHSFLIGIFRIFRFFISKWIVILGIIIFGVILGYFMEDSYQSKEITLIVQVNFGTVENLYDAIEQLDRKITEKDIEVLTGLGLYQNGVAIINKVEVEPIIDIMQIVRTGGIDDKNLEILINGSKYAKDLLTSDLFVSQYRLHKIKLKTISTADEKTIKSILDYLNRNPLLNEIKSTSIISVQKEIKHNEESINFIDSIVKSYSIRPLERETSSQMYYNNSEINNNNIHLLFEQKNIFLSRNRTLEVEFLKYDNVVQLVNEPMFQVKKGVFKNKVVLIPMLLLILFVLLSILIYFYNTAEKLSRGVK